MRKIVIVTALITAMFMSACNLKDSAEENASVTITEDITSYITNVDVVSTEPQDYRKDAISTWILQPESYDTEFVIASENEAYYIISMNETEAFYFNKEKDFISKGKTFTNEDYSFENGLFSVSYNGKAIVEMKKTDGIDDIFGEYLLTGGQYLDLYAEDEDFEQAFDMDNIKLNIQENETTVFTSLHLKGFELKNDSMIQEMMNGELLESPYRIEGDVMTITTTEGKESTLIRKK